MQPLLSRDGRATVEHSSDTCTVPSVTIGTSTPRVALADGASHACDISARMGAKAQAGADAPTPHGLAPRCARVADSSLFQNFIFAVIVANAVTLGLLTYDLSEGLRSVLNRLDDVFIGIFVIELVIRIGAYGSQPLRFFRRGWNVF